MHSLAASRRDRRRMDHLLRRRARHRRQRFHAHRKLQLHKYSSQEQVHAEQEVSFNLAVITKNNANPSEIAGVSLQDFGVDIKSRIFTSSVDWTPNSRVSFSTGYNYNWVNSDAIVDYFFNSVRHPLGHSLYFVRNNFFFVDTTARLYPRVTLFAVVSNQ